MLRKEKIAAKGLNRHLRLSSNPKKSKLNGIDLAYIEHVHTPFFAS